jgi:hypothetical protein
MSENVRKCPGFVGEIFPGRGDLRFVISGLRGVDIGAPRKNIAALYTGPKGVRFVPIFEKSSDFWGGIIENAKNLIGEESAPLRGCG